MLYSVGSKRPREEPLTFCTLSDDTVIKPRGAGKYNAATWKLRETSIKVVLTSGESPPRQLGQLSGGFSGKWVSGGECPSLCSRRTADFKLDAAWPSLGARYVKELGMENCRVEPKFQVHRPIICCLIAIICALSVGENESIVL